jgi:hypothetical protein
MNHPSDVQNSYSQFGEDGILADLLGRLPSRDKWCVEFGAYDGVAMSNTCRLIREEDYRAVMIEGDKGRFEQLKQNFRENLRVTMLNQFVDLKANSLDEILSRTGIPADFDFLSIDIDGCDFYIWESLNKYRPKIVCIEYNPTIPDGVNFVQAKDFSVTQGCSLEALCVLGRAKGYTLANVTLTNGIFIEDRCFSDMGLATLPPEILRKDKSWVTQIFTGYDGQIFTAGYGANPWNGVKYANRLRQIPALFRTFPLDTLPWFKFQLFRAWCRFFNK